MSSNSNLLPRGLPVEDSNFWRSRLNKAHAENRPASAAIYDVTQEAWEKINKATQEILSNHIKSESKVLDVGCGIGDVYPLLKQPVYYTGIDISPDFIEIAMFRYPGVQFIIGDVKKPLWGDKYFDYAIARSIEDMFNDNVQGGAKELLREIRRISKVLLLIDYNDVALQGGLVNLKLEVII